MGRMPLASVGLAIHRFNAYARHQGAHSLAPDRIALSPEEVPLHAGSSKRMVQMEFLDSTHHRQLGCRHQLRLVVYGHPREFQELALPHDWKFMSLVDHRFGLNKPAFLSASSRKSFSSASCPIFACRALRSGASGFGVVPTNTSASHASNCCFHLVIWVGWTRKCSACSASGLSPLQAAKAT